MDLPQPRNASLHEMTKRKATKHRKRHIPVGPAGVWFQSTRASSIPPTNGQKRSLESVVGDGKEEEEDDALTQKLPDFMLEDPRLSRHSAGHSGYYLSPAWTLAHRTLNLMTPSVGSLTSSVQRAAILRRYLPRQFVLFSDLTSIDINQTCAWKMPPTNQLLCQVISIRSDQSGTVARLRDEAGAVLSAWVSPALVRAEASQQSRPRSDGLLDHVDGPVTFYLRQGMVWSLRHCTLQLVDASPSSSDLAENEYDSDDDTDWIAHDQIDEGKRQRRNWDRMLLVGETNIVQAWSNSGADQMDTTDFIDWMEKRNSLTMTVLNEVSRSLPSDARYSRSPQSDRDMHFIVDAREREENLSAFEFSPSNYAASEVDPPVIPLCALQRVFPSNSLSEHNRMLQLEPNQNDEQSSVRCNDRSSRLFHPESEQEPTTALRTPSTTPSAASSAAGALQQQRRASSASVTSSELKLRSFNESDGNRPAAVSHQRIFLSQYAAPSASHHHSTERTVLVHKSNPNTSDKEHRDVSEPLKEISLSQFSAPSASHHHSTERTVQKPNPMTTEKDHRNASEPLKKISPSQFSAPSASHHHSTERTVHKPNPKTTEKDHRIASEPLKENSLSQFAASSANPILFPKRSSHNPSPKPIEKPTTELTPPILSTGSKSVVAAKSVSPRLSSNVFSAATNTSSMFNLLDMEEEEEDIFSLNDTGFASTTQKSTDKIVLLDQAKRSTEKNNAINVDSVSGLIGGSSVYQSSFFVPSGMTFESMFGDLDE